MEDLRAVGTQGNFVTVEGSNHMIYMNSALLSSALSTSFSVSEENWKKNRTVT